MEIILIAIQYLALGMHIASPEKYRKLGLITNIICLVLVILIKYNQ
jgi:di/tricarboxylate transporter